MKEHKWPRTHAQRILLKLISGRHWQYVYHFPLPQDENSTHECNQRNVLLYGVGRGRDDASKNVKRICKEVIKLFHKKLSIDVSDGGKVKKHNKGNLYHYFNLHVCLSVFVSTTPN